MGPSIFSARCAIAVMAKAPAPGRAKTRLMPAVSAEAAAALGAAFLRDVTDNLALAARSVPIDAYAAYAPAGQEALFDGHLAPGTRLLLADGAIAAPQGVDGFGRALLHATQALFAAGYGAVALLNADSPTLPTAWLIAAARHLLDPCGPDAVLGPAEDGGYYLLGLRAPHAAPFRAIAWSSASVAAETRARLTEASLRWHELPPWYDVDEPPMLERLRRALAAPDIPDAYPAPVSARALAALSMPCRPLQLASATP